MEPIQIKNDAFLRLLESKDAQELFEAVDRNRERLREWMPWVDGTRAPSDTLSFIEETIKGQAKGDYQFAIIKEERIVGVIGFVRSDMANKSSMIGYWNDEQAQGQGLITLSVQAILKIGFKKIGLNRIVIRAQPTNKRSCAVPERLGFTAEGLEKEAELLNGRFVDLKTYVLLHAEWQKTTAAHA